MWFRRGMLLIVGFLWCGCVLAQLCLDARAVYNAAPVITPVQSVQAECISLPCDVLGSSLQALELVAYEGLFLEDGGMEEVSDIAALLVRNTGKKMLESGTVVMKQQGNVLVFEVFSLPAGSDALVLEKDRKRFVQAPVSACYGWDVEGKAEPQPIIVRETGPCTLCVTNSGKAALQKIRLLFKSYDPESAMYMGGIVYEVNIARILPGQSVYVSPYYYVSGYSRVVAIEACVQNENASVPIGTEAYAIIEPWIEIPAGGGCGDS